MFGPLECRNLTVNGRRTSMRLEPMLWEWLDDIVRRESTTMNVLVSSVERRMGQQVAGDLNLTGMVRLFVIGYFKAAATEEGHRRAGHGAGDPFAGLDVHSKAKEERRRRKPNAATVGTMSLAA
ncbi:ribbon-helix-helix domain-containing protein [Azospirillum sp.]|uniref:ribbon-helix-helix domain-containing protein n=1 Tax=Azospirillum sp. TaxID=34012 RepID=UPI003D72740D